MLRIILTGTGAGEAPYIGTNGEVCKRHHSSALFIIKSGQNEEYFHIDFTPYAADGLVRAGIPSSKIGTLFFSHAHEDHCDFFRWISAKLNIGWVRYGLDPEFSTKSMDVYAPKPVIKALVKMFSRKNCESHSFSREARRICYGYKSKNSKEKEILFLRSIERNTIIQLESATIKCIGVNHRYDSVISIQGRGKTAFGFLVSSREKGNDFNVLYLTDYEHFRPEDRFKKDIREYNIDLCILGMPIPFPDNRERKRHMGMEDALKFFNSLRNEGVIKTDAYIVFTHFSDRWDEEAKPEQLSVIEKAQKIIAKYWDPNLIWIPKEDDFEISYSGGILRKNGEILK